jgi:subtilisin family serine protease
MNGATGRYLVLLSTQEPQRANKTLAEHADVQVIASQDIEAAKKQGIRLDARCAVVYEHIGVAILRCEPDAGQRLQAAASAADQGILAIEPERRVHAIGTQRMPRHAGPSVTADETLSTWGVQLTGAAASAYTGAGIRVAILDTGLDQQHPDFDGRVIVARSFVDGADVYDGNGHGTHCAGIAMGPSHPGRPPRYGVAGEADMYIGKVLGDEGGGSDGEVLDGINWAVENGCHIISMSLGSAVQPGQGYSRIFEEVARRAMAAGTIMIAAAGNDSHRPAMIAPVSHPANCPSIIAVAAIDEHLEIAPFSCGGLADEGGEVNIAAPGVAVDSSWPVPQLRQTISGTSMAAPFVTGIAALFAQSRPEVRGRQLLDLLIGQARPLALSRRDAGAGLVQAP